MSKKRNKNILIVVLVLVVGFGLLGFNGLSFIPKNNNGGSTRNYVLNTCTSDTFTTFHIHPHLAILINGQNYTIPANIGITLTCTRLVHTHDNSGTIHIESPEQRDFTLGDFFAVWGEPFSENQVLSYKTDQTHKIVMTVDGQPNSEYGNLVLRNGQQIVIEYKKAD